MSDDQLVGQFGEQLAKEYLHVNGYKILETNFRTRYGEIDIIVQKDKYLVFVEVKTRVGTRFGIPFESVRSFKIKHIKKASTYYLMTQNYPAFNYRVDVISIILKADHTVETLKHFENVTI
ncbi:MAG TPA: YraN family protein [Candidatus Nitrosocosmicus sp.]|nr:YraN family protein [Candidatus Nitrosocosmicus sp.]